jgi:hypothetical protein
MISRDDVERLQMDEIGGGSMRTRVNLLGVGGVGSNFVSLLIGMGDKMMLRAYDYDCVELHNLNRTSLFRIFDVGERKVEAAFNRARSAVKCVMEERFVDRIDPFTTLRMGITVDARDTMDPMQMHRSTWMKLAYDGGSNISFTLKPELVARHVVRLDDSDSYAVVPSFFVPASMLATLCLHFMRYTNILEVTDHRAGTVHFEIDELAEELSYEWEDE